MISDMYIDYIIYNEFNNISGWVGSIRIGGHLVIGEFPIVDEILGKSFSWLEYLL
jgi:hypothetical protein